MPREIPKTKCHWIDISKKALGSCAFEMYVTKIEDICNEFDGSPRKQMKIDTIVEAFKSKLHDGLLTSLLGRRFIISKTGQPLHVTFLDADSLEKAGLPQEYEDEIMGKTPAPPANNPTGVFGSFGSATNTPPPPKNSNAARRIALAGKCLFMAIGGALEEEYTDETGDLVICRVKKDAKIDTMIEAVFDGGEHPLQQRSFNISFGLMKEIE